MTDVFIQCRLNSTRLPKKALKKICGKTIIELVIERCKKINPIKKIILVTGPEDKNHLLIKEIENLDIEYFCGSENNLIDRFYSASKKFDTEKIIRVTADNPSIDFTIVNQALRLSNELGFDLVTNSRYKTFPLGQNFDIFTKEVLEKSWKYYKNLYRDKEKFNDTFIPITENMYNNSKFEVHDFKSEKDYSNLRLSIDYEEDFHLMNEIYNRIYYKNKYFTLQDLLHIIEMEPKLLEINSERNE